MVVFSFITNYGNRITKSKFLEILTTFSISGYAIPGIILAVAFITLISYLEKNPCKYESILVINSFIVAS